ncbi:hypothetical protein [Aliarcobacter skirrowii]|uniref:Membrane protein n=1 Tax=Aliarcobacter skirrowii CCUG 10374 TaxID=1032239 RepID=A0AAD0WN82_9BACT|nr:hypothetical protein [Aliarcobacter skirrowii]AXX84614.1 putative membrane protein [Aliarcobacter skirrowii CCUG 10374]KAB0619010.1 hypothetical protein F7P70_10015 [Aliarcobacter skirrowii CCUG 10374]RXI24701.1 hypothetical protein CP959_09700 [Aliarcobacter skirrowii CCUG 10374]SUV14781.1 Uncharacterised protein [Aliarcobacter skirrowii]
MGTNIKNSIKNLLKIMPCLYSSNKVLILNGISYRVKLFYVILFWTIQGLFGFTLYPIFGLFMFGIILENSNNSILLSTTITLVSLYILVYVILFIFSYFAPLKKEI